MIEHKPCNLMHFNRIKMVLIFDALGEWCFCALLFCAMMIYANWPRPMSILLVVSSRKFEFIPIIYQHPIFIRQHSEHGNQLYGQNKYAINLIHHTHSMKWLPINGSTVAYHINASHQCVIYFPFCCMFFRQIKIDPALYLMNWPHLNKWQSGFGLL